ncbi:hypothetical protein SDC9_195438 [bioreactor metagenome]|uniref:Uncharacterized protein n=1 Tax=bioreactor metagenome TaxID=1076179 RepID=A0A645IHQ1_9ZZZZ
MGDKQAQSRGNRLGHRRTVADHIAKLLHGGNAAAHRYFCRHLNPVHHGWAGVNPYIALLFGQILALAGTIQRGLAKRVSGGFSAQRVAYGGGDAASAGYADRVIVRGHGQFYGAAYGGIHIAGMEHCRRICLYSASI